MREAINYNALSWIRQEVGVTLKQARLELEEYAGGEKRKELLQSCAAHMHEARGPLQMVNIKGADRLACEMEEAIADLLLETVVDTETLLEQLMQGFLELPEYLSNLRSGKQDNPGLLYPLINSMRAVRGLQPLKQDAVFSPDLSARVPASVFDESAEHGNRDMTAVARTARIRFQSGLLEWYRDSGTNHGLQTLVEVLEHLQETAGSEPAARLWWVGAGIAELLRDGVIEAKPAVKRLFGQLDRQIKRLMDSGEAAFDDVLSDDLVNNLLFQLAAVKTDSARIASIRSTFGIPLQNESGPEGETPRVQEIGSELLQTVSATARDDIDRIKEQIDTLASSSAAGADILDPVADGLHALGNTLDMIGMEGLSERIAAELQQLGDLAADDGTVEGADFTSLANTLVAVDDALSNIVVHADNIHAAEDPGEAAFRQGQQAVISAVIADIDTAKDAISEFLKSSGESGLLAPVPEMLNRISGGLELVGETRLAAVAGQIRCFIANELLENHRELNGEQLDSLADAICSVEFCVEELSENHNFGERAIGVAIESLDKLGYGREDLHAAMPVPAEGPAGEPAAEPAAEPAVELTAEPAAEPEHVDEGAWEAGDDAFVESVQEDQPDQVIEPVLENAQQGEPRAVRLAADGAPGIADLQVVAPDADSEIVEIFIEEADEVLDRLALDIPAWMAQPENQDMLPEMCRAFHTIKGSGRMVGAMAAGELAWAFENLLNKVIEGVIPVNDTVTALIGQSTQALRDLVAQVKNPDTLVLSDVSTIGREVAAISQPDALGVMPDMSGDDGVSVEQAQVEDVQVSVVPTDAEPGNSDADMQAFNVQEELDTTAQDFETVTGYTPESLVADARAFPGGNEAPAVPGHHADMPGDLAQEAGDMPLTAVHADAAMPGVSRGADLPVLKQDADPDIVEIFLEEAHEELASISLKIPEWIQRPDDEALLGDIRRSLHTLKGSGRMAGAMVIGEFSWSMETLLNRLVEGTAQVGGSLFALLSQVPQALSELLRQLQEGAAPGTDIDAMIQKAAALYSGEKAEPEEQPVLEMQEEIASADGADTAPVDEDDDVVLMELFSTECREHLETLTGIVANTGDDHMVSEVHYRALHTLSGICESARVHGIGVLAASLYDYFGELYQEGRQAVPEAFAVLDDCLREMRSQLSNLPERHYDEGIVSDLLGRIAALPPTVAAEDQQLAQPDKMDAASAQGRAEEDVTNVADAVDELPGHYPAVQSVEDDQAGQSITAVEVETDQDSDVKADVGAMAGTDDATAQIEVKTTAPAQDEGDSYAGMDQELYEIFVEEATEIIDNSENVLRNWYESPDDRELMADYQRLLHTLKGGARMVDMTAIGDLSHALESLLTRVADDAISTSDDLFVLLQESHDRLADMLEKVRSRTPIDAANDLESRLDAFTRGDTVIPALQEKGEKPAAEASPPSPSAADAESRSSDDRVGEPHRNDEAAGAPVADIQAQPDYTTQGSDTGLMVQAIAGQPQMTERRKEGRARSELVRVQSDILDNLVNNAGEINIYRARMEQQISNFRFNLTELDQTINRLRDQLRQLEMETEMQILFRYEQETESHNEDFDPLEMDRYSKLQHLSRSLIESISDLRSLQGLMESTARDSETLLLQQSRVSTDLQDELIRTRMIPFAGLAPRLRRIVRQSARQLDKKVELHLRGAEGEMDRAVIERIVAPLEHMLRNAVAHGIETPEQRNKSGKRVAGSITIDFNREGTEIVLRITDDGAGLDIDAIRVRATERGLMSADADLPDSDVMQFVLQAGFSTASEITQISGRGVGMDVVNSEVKQLGGSLHIHSEAGQGSVFTIRLPYTLAINRALLITAGEQIFCVPMGSIEGVVTATPAQLQTCYEEGGQEFSYVGNSYQLMHLGTCLGISSMDLENASSQIPVLLVRAGNKRIGMQVDSLIGNREVVIKPLGAQFSMVDGISGATILGDGRVVMILDTFAVSRMKARELAPVKPVSLQEDSRLLVMVVDDSITVRKVTTRFLERNGFRVMTAKDGVDAMGLLQENVPDMMLLDIEMPRMDGFELATHMRNDERLRHVPIIIITSRTGDKHRDRAFEIGVNDYLGKPYQESELLGSINKIIGFNTFAVGA